MSDENSKFLSKINQFEEFFFKDNKMNILQVQEKQLGGALTNLTLIEWFPYMKNQIIASIIFS